MNIRWIGTPNYDAGRAGQRIDHITLHIMAGYLAGTDSQFQITSPPEARASAHYGIGRDGTIHQYVRESDTAWADANGLSNQTGIAIEHEGGLPQQQPVSDAEIEASAQLCADISRRYGLGKLWHDGVRGNVYLHREIPGSTHTTCPDLAPNGLPYQRVIDRANQLLGTTDNNREDIEVVTDTDIEKIARKVWEIRVKGVRADDRLAGIDAAANGVKNMLTAGDAWKWLTDRVYRIADMLFNRRDAAGSGMADEHGNEIKRTMYDRIVWIDKRVRELNPYKTGEPRELPIGFALTDEQLDAIADRVAARLKGDAK